MKINKAVLETVAVKPEQFPDANLPEIAFVGRSNVGKSSLLNLLTGRKKLAHVSGSPGKTRTINFYNIDGRYRIVDLPGYGYAKLSKKELEKWGVMIETYLENRKNLVKAVQLVDIRHIPSKQDVQMYDYLRYFGLSGLVVATKSDKVSKNKSVQCICDIKRTLSMTEEELVIPVSSLKKTGEDKLLSVIDDIVEQFNKENKNGR